MNHQPMRIFEGEAKPFEAFWRVVDASESESGEGEIEFYGYISEYSWWGDEVTPAKFKADLNKVGKGGPVTVRIHSGGGDVFAASAIRGMIMDYPGKVTTRIDGLCASAATYVATAGDVVKMQDSAFFMIHDPWMMAIGGVEELRAGIALLKSIKQGIVETYQSKTGLGAGELERMMSAETWMTAQEARDLGFVDEVITAPSKSFALAGAQNAAVVNAVREFENIPDDLRELLEEGNHEIHERHEMGDGDEVDVTLQSLASDQAEAAIAEGDPDGPEALEREAQALRDYLKIFG